MRAALGGGWCVEASLQRKESCKCLRYLVGENLPGGLAIPTDASGADTRSGVIIRNAEGGVTWVHSYVSPDKKQTFCIYDAPSPEAIRSAANRQRSAGGPDHQVRVLDLYFYHWSHQHRTDPGCSTGAGW